MENNGNILTTLFKSRLRRRLLALFLTNPDSRYYTRELNTMLGGSVGSLHRELVHLERIGILASEKTGNLKYFFANHDYPLFGELSGITAKTVGVYGSLTDALKLIPGVKTAFVYGSFAAGTERGHSDIDLFVIGSFNHGKLNRALLEIEKDLMREINYTAMTAEEYDEAAADKTSFVSNIMKEPKIYLLGEHK